MSNTPLRSVPFLFTLLLSLASGCANAPLTNDEIDQTCRLIDRCSGASPSCARTLIADRDDVARTGCEAEWADTFRCLLAEDSCTVPADCYVAQDRYRECLLHGPNEAGDWVDRMRRRLRRRDRVGCSTECPETFRAYCPSLETPDETLACWREVGTRYPEIAANYDCLNPIFEERTACIYELVRSSCSADVSACDREVEARRASCPEVSFEANQALMRCSG